MKHKKMLVSASPFGESYHFSKNPNDKEGITEFISKNKGKKLVVVQGLGFVGSAMLTAVASARNKNNKHKFAVIGMDLPKIDAYWRVGMINDGKLPIKSNDIDLTNTFKKSFSSGNIMATADKYGYSAADIIIVDINLDVRKGKLGFVEDSSINLRPLLTSMHQIAMRIKTSCLVIIETTMPPGICEYMIAPLFKAVFKKRGFKTKIPKLVYSYERVMPGKNYLKSIVSYYRVYSGINDASKKEAKEFFSSIINTKDYPLTELGNITASEMGKVLENSYRALNIAFIQEWTEFAELAGVNLFEVIEGIKKRSTHNNIMLPGFGVGGYCLTKDSLIADWAARKIFHKGKHLGMSVGAININDKMPFHSFKLLKNNLGKLKGRKILLMGVSYLKDVADTRFSPSELFYKICVKNGGIVLLHDPIVSYWPELKLPVLNDLRLLAKNKVDAVILTANHLEYSRLSVNYYKSLLKPKGLVVDCGNVIDDYKARLLKKNGFKICGVGKGHWNSY
ncbi:MAG: nucleotide sugar dehydrogenase [bacterium]